MKNIKQKLTQKFPFLFLVMVLSSTLLFVSCNDDDNDDMIIEIIQPTETIVVIAASNPDFSTYRISYTRSKSTIYSINKWYSLYIITL